MRVDVEGIGRRRNGNIDGGRRLAEPISAARFPSRVFSITVVENVWKLEVVEQTTQRVRVAHARPPNDEVRRAGGALVTLAAAEELAGAADRLRVDGRRQQGDGEQDRRDDPGDGGSGAESNGEKTRRPVVMATATRWRHGRCVHLLPV